MTMSSKMYKLGGIVAGAVFALTIGTMSAQAAGTLAGVDIINNVSVSYTVGGVAQPNSTDSVTFTVDNKVDLQVSEPTTTTSVIPTTTTVTEVLTFTLENQGNEDQSYDIDITQTPDGTNPLNLVADADGGVLLEGEYQIFLDDDGTPGLSGGDTQLFPNGGTTTIDATLIPDGTVDILIVADIVDTATDGDTDAFTVEATTLDVATTTITTESATNSALVIDVAFADAAGTVDAITDGLHSDTASFIVATADVLVTKAVTVINQDGAACGTTTTVVANALAIPGACIQYVITVTNNGSAVAELPVISDDISALPVTFVAFINNTAADYSVAPAEAGGIVTATILTNDPAPATGMDPADSITLTFRATVD